MAEDLLIKVDVQGDETNNLDKNIEKVGKSTAKTQTEMQKLRNELKQAKNDMLSAEEGTNKYNEALARAAKASFELRDMNSKVKASVLDIGETSKNVAGAISGLAGGFSAAQGVIALTGVESEKLNQVMVKLMAGLSVSQGLTNFVDSIENMKDLYQGVKASINALILSKNKETIATVQNTVANTAEAGAITAVGTATKGTTKAMLTALGPYALIAAAIGGIIALVISLTKKMNDIPREIKLNLELEKEAGEKLVTNIEKARKFAYEYNSAVKSGNKDLIKSLEDQGKKEFKLNKDRLKMITENVNNWRIAFDDYLEKAKLTYKQEFLLKRAAESEARTESLKSQADILKKTINTIKPDDVTDKFWDNQIKKVEEYAKSGKFLVSFNKNLNEYYETLRDYYDARKEFNQADKDLTNFEIKNQKKLKEIRTEFVPTTTVTTKEDGGLKGSGEVETFENPKSTESIFKAINDEVKKGLKERYNITERETLLRNAFLAKTEEDRLNTQYKIDKYDIINSKRSDGEKILALKELNEKYNNEVDKFNNEISEKDKAIRDKFFEQNEELYDKDLISYREFLKRKKELLITFGEATNEDLKKINQELFITTLDDIKKYSDSISQTSNVISGLLNDQMEINDNKFEKERNNLELSDEYRKADTEKQQEMMYELEKANYEKNKKIFEADKKFKIAGVIADALSGQMMIIKNFLKNGGIVNPIAIGALALETAANVATSILTIKKINSTNMNAPVPPSNNNSIGSSSSLSSSSPISPNETALTTSEDRLNIGNINNRNNSQTNVVKVSEINNIQNKVKVRESNLNY